MTAARLLMSECVAKAVRARFREVAAQSVNQCHFGDTPKGELTEYESPQLGELIDAAIALVPPDLGRRHKKPSLTVIEGGKAE
jgi:hypothetical protein